MYSRLSFGSAVLSEAANLYKFRWVWIFNIIVMLKVRYRRSFLGFLWSMIGPFSSYAVIATVFYFHSARDFGEFMSSALPGFLMFNFVLAALNNSPSQLLVNESFLRKIYLPKTVFFFGGVASDFVNYFLAQLIVMVVVTIIGWVSPQISWLLLPVFWLLIFSFVFGLSLTIGTLTVFFRDISHIVPIGTQILFYLTPVLYVREQMPVWLQQVIAINPFFYFLEFYRMILYGLSANLLPTIGICSLLATVSLLVGLYCLHSNNDRLIYYL